ncbi:hypothetical protein C5167_028188 [Papaver somniferum]|nr:hypothetical protein C5167_028188 [Papaver somniferum]
MQAELNLETPSVGCEIIPIVSLHSKEGSKVIPDDKLKFNWRCVFNVSVIIVKGKSLYNMITLRSSLCPSLKKLAILVYISRRHLRCLLLNTYLKGVQHFFASLEFKNTAQKIAWSLDAEKRRSMMKDNIALTVILEAIKAEPVSDTLNHRICVANVHVSADPENTDVKLWQVGTLIEDLERSVAHSNIPVLICADLNSLPKSAAHTLVVNGSVDLKHEELVNTPDGIIEHLKLSHKLLPLASAYSSFSRTKKGDMMDSDTKEPRFTTATLYFRNTIDYIFYSVKSLLELLDEESAIKHTAFPSPLWSSDHIALMAEFSWKSPS